MRAWATRTWAPEAIDDLRAIIVATGALDEVEFLIGQRTDEAVAALDGADLAARCPIRPRAARDRRDRQERSDVRRPVPQPAAPGEPVFSFEFFPPKTDEGERQLWSAISDLAPLSPTFVSVTYGAGGSTRDRTVRITSRILNETGMDAVAHLTCVGSTEDELREVLTRYQLAGITNLLALRGDPPGGPGSQWTPVPGGLSHADELVRLARQAGDFTIGVAAFPEGHPESPDLDTDAQVLAAKQHAGATFAVTPVLLPRRGLLHDGAAGHRARRHHADPAGDHAGHERAPARAVRGPLGRGVPG